MLDELIRLDGDSNPFYIAEVYALRGDSDEAFAWLKKGYAIRDPGISIIYEDPIFAPALRDDPRLAAFAKKLGMPDRTTSPIRGPLRGPQRRRANARSFAAPGLDLIPFLLAIPRAKLVAQMAMRWRPSALRPSSSTLASSSSASRCAVGSSISHASSAGSGPGNVMNSVTPGVFERIELRHVEAAGLDHVGHAEDRAFFGLARARR